MWSKYVTRRLATQVAQAWNFGWGKAMHKKYRLKVSKTLVFFDGQKTEYYVDLNQHQKYVAGLYKLLQKTKFLKTFHQFAETRLVKIFKGVKNSLKIDLSSLSNKELLSLYQNTILPSQELFYVEMWTVFNIGEPTANTVKEGLKNLQIPPEKKAAYLLSFSSPLTPNDVLQERLDILKLAIQKRQLSPASFSKKLSAHTKKYCHIPVYDIDHEPYNKQHFLRELYALKNPRRELAELKKTFRDRQQEYKEALKTLKPAKELKYLLAFLKNNVYLRDYRDKIRQQLNMELKKAYLEIGLRLHLSLYQTTLLTNAEIISHLRAGKIFNQNKIREREKSFLLIQNNAQAKIWSGKAAKNKAKKELKTAQVNQDQTIKGTTGSNGYAVGKARIIHTNKDLHKIRPGDIMVTTMTRQDFVTAIRLVKALVTDEGSVTAHAAIIARELRIPCVVAAKNATQIFKDGDRVEVDANKGTVKKL